MKNTCHGQQEHSLRDALESLPTVAPLIPNAASFDLRWRGLQAVRFRDSISNEFSAPPIARHDQVSGVASKDSSNAARI